MTGVNEEPFATAWLDVLVTCLDRWFGFALLFEEKGYLDILGPFPLFSFALLLDKQRFDEICNFPEKPRVGAEGAFGFLT